MSEHRFILITGLSGAGLSSALKGLEDIGFEAIDNLPVPLLETLTDQGDLLRRHVAVGVDTRTRGFSPEALIACRDGLAARDGIAPTMVFLDCGDDMLQRRFTETRRRHPLALDRPVIDGIARERQLLQPLQDSADLVIDTTLLSIHELRRLLAGHFSFDRRHSLQVFISSFSYRHGLPRQADLVFDVRFLKNPHYDPALRPLTGLDPAVGAAILEDPDFSAFETRLIDLLRPLLPRYQAEGKRYLTIAVGCTGGKHRSVFVAERLHTALRDEPFDIHIAHRDLPQERGQDGK